MPLVLERNWVGRRVVVRRAEGRTDSGHVHFADVLGDLLDLRADTAIIDTRTGRVEVTLDHVAVAKLVDPSTAEVLALEATCAQGWRAREIEEMDGWTLRANDGFTGRANSVLPLRQLRLPLPEALATAAEWYHRRRLPLRLQVPVPARRLLDGYLSGEGFSTAPDVHVLVGRLDCLGRDLNRADGPATEVVLDPEPDGRWLSRYRDGTVPPAARDLLVRHDRVRFASVIRDGQVLAIARGVVDDGWLGVTAVEVDPGVRRQGLASAVMSTLWDWAATTYGAARSYLQVESTNAGALALYESLGYWHHHDYRYLTEPDDEPSS